MVDDEDDDVAEERDRVMSGDAEDDTLVLHELTKVFITAQIDILFSQHFYFFRMQ